MIRRRFRRVTKCATATQWRVSIDGDRATVTSQSGDTVSEIQLRLHRGDWRGRIIHSMFSESTVPAMVPKASGVQTGSQPVIDHGTAEPTTSAVPVESN